MRVEELAIPAVKLLTPTRHGDSRGLFCEVYNARTFAAAGITDVFVQDNQSVSSQAGTIRGLHLQRSPFAQAKLVRVVRGRIFDVAVDLRAASPTYGRHVGVELSAANWAQLLVPAGFAHGFCTLEPDTEVIYKVTEHYAPEADTGILWSDPELGIEWPVSAERAVLSDKDRRLPRLKELGPVF